MRNREDAAQARKALLRIADETADGVFHCRSWGHALDQRTVDALEVIAAHGPNGKARLCMHPSTAEREQQMLVALSDTCNDEIHHHPTKSETVIWVSGMATHRTYDESGRVLRETLLGPEDARYVHTEQGVPHNVVVRSDVFVFWEFALGPFLPGSTVPHVFGERS